MASVMERLKTETADQHRAAERHPFQAALVRGDLSRPAYAAYLAQMLLVHRAMTTSLRAASARCTPLRTVLREEHDQVPRLLLDLAHLGVDPGSVRPTPATADLVASIQRGAQADGLALLGYHYVLEGSNNGARYIARAVRRSLGLETDGVRFLDPYGEGQRAVWGAFKRDAESANLSDHDADRVVAAACHMFDAIGRVLDDLHASQPVGA